MQKLANKKWLEEETGKQMKVLITFNFNKATIEEIKANLKKLDLQEKLAKK